MRQQFPGLVESSLPFSIESLTRLLDMVIKAGDTAVLMRKDVDISTKTGPEDLVTCADKKLSEILMSALQQEFPNDHIVSEEHPWESGVSKERRWFIDPIDGTKHYVNETGRWSVMLGLVEKNEPIFGIFYIPAFKILYFGGKSCGSYKWSLDGEAEKLDLEPLTIKSAVSALISKNDVSKNQWVTTIPGIEIVTASSIGLDVHEVLTGNVDSFVHIRPTLKAWDTAAPAAVALGAGLEIGSELGQGFKYPADDATHKECVVIGRKGIIGWWQRGYEFRNNEQAVTKPAVVNNSIALTPTSCC